MANIVSRVASRAVSDIRQWPWAPRLIQLGVPASFLAVVSVFHAMAWYQVVGLLISVGAVVAGGIGIYRDGDRRKEEKNEQRLLAARTRIKWWAENINTSGPWNEQNQKITASLRAMIRPERLKDYEQAAFSSQTAKQFLDALAENLTWYDLQGNYPGPSE